jgi:hypothetical protein
MENKETAAEVEYTHTIEELLEPLADKDPRIINAFLTTAINHPGTRLSLWALANLYSCNPEEYPEVNKIPEIRNLREEGLTEIEKRQFLAEKAIEEIKDISLRESEIEFSLIYPPDDEALGDETADLRKIGKALEVLTKFRRDLLKSTKGAGPSIREAPGKSPV